MKAYQFPNDDFNGGRSISALQCRTNRKNRELPNKRIHLSEKTIGGAPYFSVIVEQFFSFQQTTLLLLAINTCRTRV